MKDNPFATPSQLEHGVPDFTKIKNEHYLPAFKAGIDQQREEIQAIVDNNEAPTFDNVIIAYEKSGAILDRVSNVFFAISSADATKEIEDIEAEVIPLLTSWGNEITFNNALFQKVKAVYDNEYNTLEGEDKRLLEEIYKDFERSGANLPADKKAELEKINNRIAVLQQTFGKQLPEASNASIVWVETVDELAGLSESDIAQCKADAESNGGKAPYAIVITNTTQQPILATLENRALRERIFKASIHRTDETSEYNTYPIIAEMAQLRHKKGEILGYANYAAYSLSNTMAENPENASGFLKSLIAAYKPKAEAETKEIQAYAQKTQGTDFVLQPYDRFYYSAKMKEEKFHFSEDEVRPYFEIWSTLENGVFYAANRVYGISFEERFDLPTYNPDMKVYNVLDKDGSQLSIFYVDFFRRPTKRGGAWMSAFAKQSHFNNQIPIIYNVMNVAKAPEGQPSLLTWDEVTTMFHEFGHALHGMLSDCKYNTLSGTAVARDFVELPSQFNEYFASIPEVFSNYAKHYQTGEPMPEELKSKMLESITFHAAYALGENLAASSADMAFHTLPSADAINSDNVASFEAKALEEYGLLDPQVPPRYYTTYFNHVWGGGYAAGYYSYLWSEVLSANVGEYFTEHGSLNPEVGQAFRDKILSKGNTQPLNEIFTDFTGLEQPNAESLLPARGL
ncbi:MAG: M3 family metallopeptidase [Porphyromonas sp.]|nr:M3 family metallopeptidase [Porphyromonas sp.]